MLTGQKRGLCRCIRRWFRIFVLIFNLLLATFPQQALAALIQTPDAISAEQGAQPIERMTRLLAHRGPDDEGFHREPGVGLGMRRLSIIDLETGHQPIANETGDVRLVNNGEIYNFRELRSRLESLGHRFRTKSDTEVLAHGYEEWGRELPRHLARKSHQNI